MPESKLKKALRKSYEEIAQDFSASRKQNWPELDILKQEIKSGSSILDLGCGNGRLLQFWQELKLDYQGLDFSKNMLEEAQKLHPKAEFTLLDFCKDLAKITKKFNYVVSIAALHHIPGNKLRLKVLREIHGLLQVNGKLLFTVWNLRQRKYLKYLYLARLKNWGRYGWNDCFIPWGNGEKKVWRYYHAFSQRELVLLLKKSGFQVELIAYGPQKRNLIVVASKG